VAQHQAIAESGGGRPMTTLVTGARLKGAVEAGSFIKGGDATSVEAVKYDFHMGARVLKAFYGQPKDISGIPEERRTVDPGEVVFVLTEERLDLPRDMLAVLTPKRRLAHGGIIMLGGLAVDPRYKGVLVIGLYNFSSTPYPLIPGSKLIGAVFYELQKDELQEFDVASPSEIKDFPPELILLIQNYKPLVLKGVQDDLDNTKAELAALKKDLGDDKGWREDFKKDLAEHNKQLGLLIEGLKDEKEVRSREDEKINNKLEKMSNWFLGIRASGVIAALVAAAILGWGVPKILDALTHKPTPQGVSLPAAASKPPPPQDTAAGKQP